MARTLFRKSSSSSSSMPPKATPRSAWFESEFDTFSDKDDGTIGPDGIEKLCKALEVDPTDPLVLVLAWKLGAAQMGYFSREEWKHGADAGLSSVTSMSELKKLLAEIHASCKAQRSGEQLRSLHAYTHKFCREERKKTIDVASALAMLQLLHGPDYPKHVPLLSEFLQTHETATKRGVSADEWAMLLNFCKEIQPDCSNYQDDGAWPLLLDDYVEWYREKHGSKDE